MGSSGLGIGEGRLARWALVALAVGAAFVLLLLPLAVLFVQAFAAGLGAFLAAVADPDAAASIRLSLLVAAIVVPANAAFGVAAAWCLTRFEFAGRRALASLVGLPFSVSPVVSGLCFVLLFGAQGWFAPLVAASGVPVIFALPGIVLATAFVTLPFVAAQLIPLLESQGTEAEEAGLVLGAGGWQLFLRVTLPRIRWGLFYGVMLCSARCLGEFGAVSVVSGRIRGQTNTVPLHIEVLYQEYNIVGAFAVATLLAGVALLTIAARAALEWRSERQERRGGMAVRA